MRWGGKLIKAENLEKTTRLTVLSHPLGKDGEPRPTDGSGGRFIALVPAFLDPKVYAAGRQVTAVGTVTGTLEGKVGEADYTYPVIDARQLYLWPPERSYGGGSSFFGFGVGSGGSSGVGVGIGF